LSTTTNGRLLAELAEQHIDGDAALRKLRDQKPERARARAMLRIIETPRRYKGGANKTPPQRRSSGKRRLDETALTLR
jgi:hypothetical protein